MNYFSFDSLICISCNTFNLGKSSKLCLIHILFSRPILIITIWLIKTFIHNAPSHNAESLLRGSNKLMGFSTKFSQETFLDLEAWWLMNVLPG